MTCVVNLENLGEPIVLLHSLAGFNSLRRWQLASTALEHFRARQHQIDISGTTGKKKKVGRAAREQ